MSISYHAQFQENKQKKNWNGLFAKPKASAGGKLPPPAQRPTAVVKQTIRSDTFTLPSKREETNFKVPDVNQTQNGLRRRQLTNKPAVVSSPPPVEQKRTVLPMRRSGVIHSSVKQVNSNTNLQRKPVRFTTNYHNNNNNSYYSSTPSAYYPKSAPLVDPLPQDQLDKSRRMHRTSDDYIIHRQNDLPAYAYTDYQTVSNNIPTTSYMTSLPPISQSANQIAPTVVIHPKETVPSNPPTVIIHSKENKYSRPPTVIPSYHSSAPMMILPSSSAPPNSTMFMPNTTYPSYPQNSTMFLPNTTTMAQPPVQTYYMQSPYMPQSLFYPMPFLRPNPPPAPPPAPAPPPPPPPPPPHQTIITQSSSSSAAAPTTIQTENKTEENHATIFVNPNSAKYRKNVTIQLKMLDEDPPPQRVVRVVQEPDDVYYVEPEPQRIIYEQPRHRTAVFRRPPPPPVNEYVYHDEYRHALPRYVDDHHRPLAYQDEIVYVDDRNKEVEYIYDEPVYYRRNSKNSRRPPSLTNIVYQ